MSEALTVAEKSTDIRSYLELREGVLSKALSGSMPVDKMITTIVTAVRKNPDLMKCDRSTLFGAAIEAATLGLSVDGVLGEGYILPFWSKKKKRSEAQFIPGYQGFITLAYRDDRTKEFYAACVYKGDEFDYQLGTDKFIKHKPTIGVLRNQDDIIYAYAVHKNRLDGVNFEVMTADEIEYIRQTSPGANNPVWRTSKDRMYAKTAVRRLSKYLDLSPQFKRAVNLSETVEELGESQNLDVKLLNMDLPESEKRAIEEAEQAEYEESLAEEKEQKKEESKQKGKDAMKVAEVQLEIK